MLQEAEEAMAEAKQSLYVLSNEHVPEGVELDETLMVEGMPVRLQSQKERKLYLNGKAV